MKPFELGVTVFDIITGFEGVVTGHCRYISGCDQYLLQPKVNKQGAKQDGQWFDEQRLKAVPNKKRVVLDNSRGNGADMIAPVK